jgi:hypothetical protein
MRTLLFFCALTFVFVNGQDGKFRCEADNNALQSIFGGSYYTRSTRFRCIFENVKSLEELAKMQITRLTADTVVTVVFTNSSLSMLPDKMFSNLGIKNVS